MPQQRHELAVVATESPGPARPSRSIVGTIVCVIVEAAQPRFGVALDVRGVRRAPVQAGARVAEQMKGAAAERIAARRGIGAHCVERDAETSGSRRGALRASGRRSSVASGSPRRSRTAPRGNLPQPRRARAGCTDSGGRRRPACRDAAAPRVVGADDLHTYERDEQTDGHRAASPPRPAAAGRRNEREIASRPRVGVDRRENRPSAAKFATIADPP